MKRWLALFLLCLTLLIVPVKASGIDSWEIDAAVGTNGETKMKATLIIKLDQPVYELVFPLGDGARDLTINGVERRVKRVNGVPSAVLESETGFTGTLQFDLTYTLKGCLDPEQDWSLVLPLLAKGLEYSVEQTTFRITLPETTEAIPSFRSGYRMEDVDNYISYKVDGTIITGTVSTTMLDHEELVLMLETDPEVFPRTGVSGMHTNWMTIVAAVFFGLALVYWFFFLRWKPVRALPQTQPPVGLMPGEIGSQLLTHSPDLALMILSWAQAGYLTIYMDRDMAVTLHKRMPMGNECGKYEADLFHRLFLRGNMVECASYRFQDLCQKVASDRPRIKRQFAKGGSPVILRALGALAGAMVFAAMGECFMDSGIVKWLLVAVMGVTGIIAAWLLQEGLQSILSWKKKPGMLALAVVALAVVLGILSGCILLAVVFVLAQVLLGVLVLFGPRRSEVGRNTVQSLLGLRKYLRTISNKQINRIIQTDPGYYYTMSPYALALGVDRAFARRFSRIQLGDCPWLITQLPPTGNAKRWSGILRQVTRSIRGDLPRAVADPRPRRRTRYPARRRSRV